MFKNLTIYTLPPGWLFDEDAMRSAAAFVPCDTWSMESGGFLPVLDDRLIYPVGDQLAMKFGIERRILPPAVIQRDEAESAQEQFEIDFALMAGTYQYIVDALVSEFGGIEGRE
ncbi:MAG: recombination-associated protein RdgC [Pseudomonadales bacterium]|nr:recombination-associated protein RdgC [Pseudomonadales bacterium]